MNRSRSAIEEVVVTMEPGPRSRLGRYPQRGSHDPATIHAILDAGLLAHIAFAVEGQPFVIPTLYARNGDKLYLHGSAASRMLHHLERGVAACVNVTLVDGLVLARSAFHHSINYRSVVAFGTARKLEEAGEKREALRAVSEHVLRGRWDDVRPPLPQELKATSVLEFSIEEASAKIRTGPPLDDEEDYALPVWAGIVPFRLAMETPVADDRLAPEIPLPDYLLAKREK